MTIFVPLLAILSISIGLSKSSTIVVKNNCPYTIWVGTNGQTEWETGHHWSDPANGGFELKRDETRQLNVEVGWAGRIWGRTNCHFDNGGNTGQCESGRCADRLECAGLSGEPPASLAELTLDQNWSGQQFTDFYSISLVDGFNVRMRIAPRSTNCPIGDCPFDMNTECPGELQKKNDRGQVVACASNGGVQAWRDYAARVCPEAYGYWNDDIKTRGCNTVGPGLATFDISFC